MSTDPPPSPSGFQVRKRGEGLERSQSKAGEIVLRVAEANLEMIEGSLKAGHRLDIVPATVPTTAFPTTAFHETVETYLITEGELVEEKTAETVKPGDVVLIKELQEPVTLTAKTDVRFFYTSTRPAFHEISESLRDLKELAELVAEKDRGTAAHCERLRDLARAVGLELRLPSPRLYKLDYGAYLHDLGKIEVPDRILQKPDKLTPEEWGIIKQHPVTGRRLLEATFMASVGEIVEQHHERLDGSGYPYGLSGDAILTEAYIVAVVDTYDAMTTDRPYRRALSHGEAIEKICGLAGRHYPHEVVTAFLTVMNRLTMLPDGLALSV